VHELGRDLYKRLVTMGGHVENVGRRLGDTVKYYNQFIGSLESAVLPQARKFNELEVEGTTTTELEVLTPVDQEVRELARGRDILIPPELPAGESATAIEP
jgi:DNA recombination protein RmuC